MSSKVTSYLSQLLKPSRKRSKQEILSLYRNLLKYTKYFPSIKREEIKIAIKEGKVDQKNINIFQSLENTKMKPIHIKLLII